MPELTTEQTFQLAVRHHQTGQLPRAEQLYRQTLAADPNHASASHNLGVLYQQVGRNELAVALIRQAIAFKPDWPEAYCNLGEAYRVSGRLDEALATLHQAIALNPAYATAHYNLGNVLKDQGQLGQAIASYRRAIELKPDYFKAHGNLGSALQDKGLLDEAIASYRRVVALMPGSPEGYCNLGGALKDNGQLDEAVAAFRRAIAIDPNGAPAHSNLGVVLKAKGQLDDAIAAFRQAIALQPTMYQALGNLGNALKDKGELDEAIAANRQAIDLKPDYAEAHRNLALLLLVSGDFAQGWDEYEWRWKCADSRSRDFAQPLWDGRPLAGATLLLHAEQGLGDTIQFVRYLPLAAQKGGNIVLECQAELVPLLKPMAGGCRVVAQGQELPAFDVHCPLLSLPRVFGTVLESIPRQVPYLRADPGLAGKWRERMSPDAVLFKVGLAWSADKPGHGPNRSVALSALAPLGQVQGVSFYSLQKQGPAEQASDPLEGLTLTDWTEELKDSADTAALIANLDLVISVDTAVVHLAGAMGKRAGLLLPFASDWRWLQKRKDSPWYPTIRLFRQPAIGDWDSVVRQMAQVLRGLRDKRMTPDAKNAGH